MRLYLPTHRRHYLFNTIIRPMLLLNSVMIVMVILMVATPVMASCGRDATPNAIAFHHAMFQHTANNDADDDPNPAKISVILKPEPSIYVPADGIITYTIAVRNTGERFADVVRLWLEFNPQHLTVVGTSFERNGDWVSKTEPGYLRLDFQGVGKDATHSAVVQLHVAPDVPQGTVFTMWAVYEWLDHALIKRNNRSNAAPVIVGKQPMTSPWVWMTYDQFNGRTGNTFSFFSDRFVPGERIKVWLNTRGVIHRRSDLDSQANGDGHFWIHMPALDMQPGLYQLIVMGERSDLIAGTLFWVE